MPPKRQTGADLESAITSAIASAFPRSRQCNLRYQHALSSTCQKARSAKYQVDWNVYVPSARVTTNLDRLPISDLADAQTGTGSINVVLYVPNSSVAITSSNRCVSMRMPVMDRLFFGEMICPPSEM